MSIPSDAQIEALHHELSPSPKVFDLVFTHSNIVLAITEQLIATRNLQVNKPFVHAACLLHDIGAYKLYDADANIRPGHKYVEHGVEGYKLLSQKGYDEAFCRVAERHTGVGLTKAKIALQGLPLPHKDYVAETHEERLIMYADAFHTKKLGLRTVKNYMTSLKQYDADFPPMFAQLVQQFGEPDLTAIATKFNLGIVD